LGERERTKKKKKKTSVPGRGTADNLEGKGKGALSTKGAGRKNPAQGKKNNFLLVPKKTWVDHPAKKESTRTIALNPKGAPEKKLAKERFW